MLEAVWVLAAEPLLFGLAGSALCFRDVPQSTVLKALLVVTVGARLLSPPCEPYPVAFVAQTHHPDEGRVCSPGILVKVPVTFFGLTFTKLGWRERLLLAFSALHMVVS